MGNVVTSPEAEDDEIKKFLKDTKEKFESKWELKAKNEQLVEYFDIKSYNLIKTVGTGSFGRVMVCTPKDTVSKFHAVKCLSKDCIMEKEQLEHTYSEYKIMATIPAMDFLVNLLSFGQDNAYLYMTFEFVAGGELFSLLRSVGRIPEITATFYGAQVLAALHYLHNMDVLYRDLKPENILFTNNGYLKLTDFGFAKRCLGRTFTLCGTPEYLAPEIILCQGYHKAVDWWAFGVLVFEMVCGHPPFYSDNPMEIYKQEWLRKRHKFRMSQRGLLFNHSRFFEESEQQQVPHDVCKKLTLKVASVSTVSCSSGETSLSKYEDDPCSMPSSLSKVLQSNEVITKEDLIGFPDHVSDDFKDFISKILNVDPTKRIGNLKDGPWDIKRHPLFKKVLWGSVLAQKIKAPYIPKLAGECDMRNYNSCEEISREEYEQEKHRSIFDVFPNHPNRNCN